MCLSSLNPGVGLGVLLLVCHVGLTWLDIEIDLDTVFEAVTVLVLLLMLLVLAQPVH